MERSDVVAQIVDARNPLMFRSLDLEAYVKEVAFPLLPWSALALPLGRELARCNAQVDSRKQCVLVINKADYLSRKARQMWADYFTKQ